MLNNTTQYIDTSSDDSFYGIATSVTGNYSNNGVGHVHLELRARTTCAYVYNY